MEWSFKEIRCPRMAPGFMGGGGRGRMRYCVSDGCLAVSRGGVASQGVQRPMVGKHAPCQDRLTL